MSGWRGQLRRASFRGARFFVETAGGEYGRRFADHEYPGRDTPFAEDLGRQQRVWRFAGYVLGDGYPAERDRLLEACEKKGAGELVHPTIGSVQAVCRSVSFTEERERGRICTFQLEFAESGQLQEPSSAADDTTGVEIAADGLGTAAPAGFLQSFSVAGGGNWVADAAAGDVKNLAAAFSRLRLAGPGLPQGPLVESIAYLDENAAGLVAHPDLLVPAVDRSFAAFTDAGEAGPVVAAMLTLATKWQAGAPPGSGGVPFAVRFSTAYAQPRPPLYVQRERNRAVFERFVHELALREVGYAAPGLELDSYDQAIAVRDQIIAIFVEIEQATADAGEDDIFAALAELRGAITRMIQARAASLNPLVTYRALATINSIRLAWRLYQDLDRELEVCARVRARNPAFLPHSGRVLAPEMMPR